MAFLLIVCSIAIRCERAFGLTVVWAHPHQACFPTLPEATCKLVLLADVREDWLYSFVWLNDAVAHAPLSDEGHISAMMDGMPGTDAHGWLHQLQVCKLLQWREEVVCPEGLNGDLKALQFSFPELPLWDAAAPSKPFREPWFLEMDLTHVQPEGMTTAIQAPTTTLVPTHSPADAIKPPCDFAMAINQHLQGALEWLQWTSSTASTPVSQCSMPWKEPPLAALGPHPQQKEQKIPSGKRRQRQTAIPTPAATFTDPHGWPH